MKSTEIKKIIMQHNQYASEVMNTNYNTRENTLLNYKNYIESNPIISELISKIINESSNAPDLFIQTENALNVSRDSDKIKDMAILYKHLCFMINDKRELYIYAHSIYWRMNKYNDAIRELLKISMKPLIEYIQLRLEELLLEAEAEEKQITASVHNGDVIMGGNVQKVEHGNANMKDVGNDKSRKKFYIQKESFWLGVLSAIISGLVVYGVEELIRHLIA